MSRRASSSLHPGVIFGIVAVVAVAIFAGKSLLGRKPSSFSDVPKLSMTDYLENGNSLRGNEYVIEGKVDEKLRSSDHARIVSVQVGGGSDLIGIEIPSEISMNIEREQRYAFRVKINQGGIAVATAVNRL